MKALNLITGLIICLIALPAGAAEGDKKTRAEKRVEWQNKSISKQYKNGNLTIEEANAARERQRQIKAALSAATADGTFTADEKARIEALQDQARAKITLQSTDKQEGKEKTRAAVRQFKQKSRVKDGLADDSLTDEEAADIKKYIKANAAMIKGAKEDGVLTAEEKKRIEARQDFLSAEIYLKRHNDVKRGPASGTGPQSIDQPAVDPGAGFLDTVPVPTESVGVSPFIPAAGVE